MIQGIGAMGASSYLAAVGAITERLSTLARLRISNGMIYLHRGLSLYTISHVTAHASTCLCHGLQLLTDFGMKQEVSKSKSTND
jgi:hypothetical protein